jgi:hypothetical protein
MGSRTDAAGCCRTADGIVREGMYVVIVVRLIVGGDVVEVEV